MGSDQGFQPLHGGDTFASGEGATPPIQVPDGIGLGKHVQQKLLPFPKMLSLTDPIVLSPNWIHTTPVRQIRVQLCVHHAQETGLRTPVRRWPAPARPSARRPHRLRKPASVAVPHPHLRRPRRRLACDVARSRRCSGYRPAIRRWPDCRHRGNQQPHLDHPGRRRLLWDRGELSSRPHSGDARAAPGGDPPRQPSPS